MCQAIIELFQEEYDAGIKQATEDGIQCGLQQGLQQGLIELVRDNLLPLDEAVKRAGISREEFVKLL